jgi:hypothetical protein
MEKKEKVLKGVDTKELESVKLVDGGMGGVVISYTERDSRRDGMPEFKNFYKGVKFTAPCPANMVVKFEELKGHLLDICGYPLEGTDRDLLDLNVELTGVMYVPTKGFVLSGKLNVLDGKVIALNTPLLQDEGDYPGYTGIVSGINELYYETKEYLSGRNRMSTVAMIEMVAAKKNIEGYDKEEFGKMTYNEQMKLALTWLENAGCAVLAPEGLEEELKGVEVPKEFLEKKKEEKRIALVESEGDDFGIADENLSDEKEIAIEEDDEDFGI